MKHELCYRDGSNPSLISLLFVLCIKWQTPFLGYGEAVTHMTLTHTFVGSSPTTPVLSLL